MHAGPVMTAQGKKAEDMLLGAEQTIRRHQPLIYVEAGAQWKLAAAFACLVNSCRAKLCNMSRRG